MMVKSTTAWVQGMGQVEVPEKKFTDLPDNHYPRILHHNTHTLAVFECNTDKCVGWIESRE